jgi:hypothetical protein
MLRVDWLYPDTKIFASSFLLLLLQMTLGLGTSSTLLDALMPSGKFASKFEVGKLDGSRRLTSGGLTAGSLISTLCSTSCGMFNLSYKKGRGADACAGNISGDVVCRSRQ